MLVFILKDQVKGTLFSCQKVKQCVKTNLSNSTAICCKTTSQKLLPLKQGLRLCVLFLKVPALLGQKLLPLKQGLRLSADSVYQILYCQKQLNNKL